LAVFGTVNVSSDAGGTIYSPISFVHLPNCFMQASWNGTNALLVTNRTVSSFTYSGNVGKGAYLMIGC